MEIIYMHTQQWVRNIKEMFKVNVVTVENFQRYWKTKKNTQLFESIWIYVYLLYTKAII